MPISSTSRAFGVLCLSAASALVWAQDPGSPLPVTRLSGAAAADDQPAPAPRPTPLRGLPVTRLAEGSHGADFDAAQRLTVSFAQPASVRDVLFLLVRGTRFSLAMDSAVKGTFVGDLKDVTLRQAIDSVLTPNALSYDVDGTVIRVFPQRTQTRLFDLNLLNVERGWQRSAGASDDALTSRVPQGSLLDELTSGIATLLSDVGRVHVDRRAGVAQVTDYPDRLDRVAAYLEAVHVRGSRQVRLRARVLEVTLPNLQAIDWQAVRARLGLSEQAITAGCVVDPAALQAALAAQGNVEVVAAPEFVGLNNEPAVVRTVTPGSSALTLTVVPQIADDGIVQLSVSPSWTHATMPSDSPSAMGITESDTVVRVADGSTALVTGLLHVDDGKGRESRTREIVVLLTPTVVNAGPGLATR
jgi:type II secretory pathway component GspD/PulD (secretin)